MAFTIEFHDPGYSAPLVVEVRTYDQIVAELHNRNTTFCHAYVRDEHGPILNASRSLGERSWAILLHPPHPRTR